MVYGPDFLTSELKYFQRVELSTKDDKNTTNIVCIADSWIGLCLMAIDNNTKVMNYDMEGNLMEKEIEVRQEKGVSLISVVEINRLHDNEL